MSFFSSKSPAPRPDAPIVAILGSFPTFVRTQSLSGIVLMVASLTAIVIANSPLSAAYEAILHIPLAVRVGTFTLELDLLHWINDGLMAVFFLVVGLEIKREVMVGELATIRKATLPIAAAIGGMLFPALIYLAFNYDTPAERGWGVPIATDIAFALGILALLGKRVPLGLKIFLTALAIVDDLGAVLVIALFYTSSIELYAIGGAAVMIALLVIINVLGVHSRAPYLALGLGLWLFVLLSGVHATIAGVLLAMAIPVRARVDTEQYSEDVHNAVLAFGDGGELGDSVPTTSKQRAAIRRIENVSDHAMSPLHRLEHSLHGWTAFAILPIFALANAGIRVVDMNLAAAVADPITIGIVLGLFLGKSIGVFGMSRLAVRAGLAELSDGVTWRHIYGVACLAGVGFTMSLFITNLAFLDVQTITAAKLGIVIGSVVSGVWGFLVLRSAGDPNEQLSNPVRTIVREQP